MQFIFQALLCGMWHHRGFWHRKVSTNSSATTAIWLCPLLVSTTCCLLSSLLRYWTGTPLPLRTVLYYMYMYNSTLLKVEIALCGFFSVAMLLCCLCCRYDIGTPNRRLFTRCCTFQSGAVVILIYVTGTWTSIETNFLVVLINYQRLTLCCAIRSL